MSKNRDCYRINNGFFGHNTKKLVITDTVRLDGYWVRVVLPKKEYRGPRLQEIRVKRSRRKKRCTSRCSGEYLRQMDCIRTQLWKAKAPKEKLRAVRGNLSGFRQGTGTLNYCACCLFFLAKGRGREVKSGRDFLIVTNNPLVRDCLSGYYELDFDEQRSYRDILIKVRDLVYAGHGLYTHPISGSVKPNETPYRSVVVSKSTKPFDAHESELVANAVQTFDKFTARNRVLSEQMVKDFQLIDYTLLCGALDFDAAAGLSKLQKQK